MTNIQPDPKNSYDFNLRTMISPRMMQEIAMNSPRSSRELSFVREVQIPSLLPQTNTRELPTKLRHLQNTNSNFASFSMNKMPDSISSLSRESSGQIIQSHPPAPMKKLKFFFKKTNRVQDGEETGEMVMVSQAEFMTVHEFHETCHSGTFYFIKKDSKRCSDTTTPGSIHTKDESKRGSAFAFIFGVN